MTAHTVVGINAQINPEQSSGWVLVGYDRSFAALVPRSVQTQANDGAPTQNAMAALACSSLWVKGVTIKRYTEAIATGEAAQTFAKNLETDPKGVKDFFICFKNKPAEGTR
ncbi:MAG: hypothetical protein AB7F89_19620 [Pirellulaceae bacterium]